MDRRNQNPIRDDYADPRLCFPTLAGCIVTIIACVSCYAALYLFFKS